MAKTVLAFSLMVVVLATLYCIFYEMWFEAGCLIIGVFGSYETLLALFGEEDPQSQEIHEIEWEIDDDNE